MSKHHQLRLLWLTHQNFSLHEITLLAKTFSFNALIVEESLYEEAYPLAKKEGLTLIIHLKPHAPYHLPSPLFLEEAHSRFKEASKILWQSQILDPLFDEEALFEDKTVEELMEEELSRLEKAFPSLLYHLPVKEARHLFLLEKIESKALPTTLIATEEENLFTLSSFDTVEEPLGVKYFPILSLTHAETPSFCPLSTLERLTDHFDTKRMGGGIFTLASMPIAGSLSHLSLVLVSLFFTEGISPLKALSLWHAHYLPNVPFTKFHRA